MEREVEGGIGMGNTCKPMAVSFQCMTKFTTNKKKKEKKDAELNRGISTPLILLKIYPRDKNNKQKYKLCL